MKNQCRACAKNCKKTSPKNRPTPEMNVFHFQMIYESFEKMSKIVLPNAEMPNVTAKCSMQFVNFAKELFNKTHWAIQGFIYN